MENMMKFADKRPMPLENPYKKPEEPRPSLEVYLQKCQESVEPVLIMDLDDYGITDLKKIPFRPEVMEVSLFDNQVFNPNDIAEVLMKLSNLRGLWLNENPVVGNCSNFEIIGDYFDKLEIFNSKLTAKAGEWAILFYARDQGVTSLEEIVHLDLSGKNLLMVDDLSFLLKMTNLKTLDIGDNVDMYKPREMLANEAKKRAEGSGNPDQFDFKENKHHRDVLLHNLPTVEHLICDLMLEAYILDTRPFRNYMPNLKTINKVPIEVKEMGERTAEKRVLEIMNKMWRFV